MKTRNTLVALAIIAFTAISCNGTKETKEDTMTTTNDKEPTTNVPATGDMITGTVIYSDKEDDCAYVIKTADGRMFDPINMDKSFQKDGMKVAFTFGALRMANRCMKANPVSLIEMKQM